MRSLTLVTSILLLFGGCTKEGVAPRASPNILLIIADDMGLDATPGYDVGTLKPNMPTLSRLSDEGMVFKNLWSSPTCTPTRSTILTGKYGINTGVLSVGDVINRTETSLMDVIRDDSPYSYNSTLIGKWHLSNSTSVLTDLGIQSFSTFTRGGLDSYEQWSLQTETETIEVNEYSTSKFTDLAIEWIGEQDQPWFLWLAYNAPHTPYHLPPSHLHDRNLSPAQSAISSDPQPYYFAALEALDTEMGRLLNSIPARTLENTYVIFVGDNGTPSRVAQSPYQDRRTKDSMYQGGINVPLIISGPGVTATTSTALVNTTDLFSTIAAMAGTGVDEINNSHSLLPVLEGEANEIRDFAYSELKDDVKGGYCIRNGQYKLIIYDDDTKEMYDLTADPFETEDLLLQVTPELSAEKEKLIELVNQIR